MLVFHLSCVPPTASHHRKRIVRVGRFSRLADAGSLVAAKEAIDVLLLPHRPAAPIAGPVKLSLEFTWPWRTAETKKVRALGRVYRTTRPDCSNLAKTTEDRLVAMRFIEDDGLVVSLSVRKFYGDTPGIRVEIMPVDAENARIHSDVSDNLGRVEAVSDNRRRMDSEWFS